MARNIKSAWCKNGLIKVPIRHYREKPRPFKILETGIRVIDTLNPIAEGGTGFIPWSFGFWKTVLQHNLSKYAETDSW